MFLSHRPLTRSLRRLSVSEPISAVTGLTATIVPVASDPSFLTTLISHIHPTDFLLNLGVDPITAVLVPACTFRIFPLPYIRAAADLVSCLGLEPFRSRLKRASAELRATNTTAMDLLTPTSEPQVMKDRSTATIDFLAASRSSSTSRELVFSRRNAFIATWACTGLFLASLMYSPTIVAALSAVPALPVLGIELASPDHARVIARCAAGWIGVRMLILMKQARTTAGMAGPSDVARIIGSGVFLVFACAVLPSAAALALLGSSIFSFVAVRLRVLVVPLPGATTAPDLPIHCSFSTSLLPHTHQRRVVMAASKGALKRNGVPPLISAPFDAAYDKYVTQIASLDAQIKTDYPRVHEALQANRSRFYAAQQVTCGGLPPFAAFIEASPVAPPAADLEWPTANQHPTQPAGTDPSPLRTSVGGDGKSADTTGADADAPQPARGDDMPRVAGRGRGRTAE